MIKLSENKSSLVNLGVTIKAIEGLNYLIKNYSEDRAGPAYAEFKYVPDDLKEVQIDRKIMVKALEEQRERLYAHMENLGIDAKN